MTNNNEELDSTVDPYATLTEMLNKESEVGVVQSDPTPTSDESKQETQPDTTIEETADTFTFDKPPTRHDTESDAQYNLRVDMWSAKNARDNADTEEEKSLFDQKLKGLRKNLSTNSGDSDPKIQISSTAPVQKEDVDKTELEEVLELLKPHFASKDDMSSTRAELIAEARRALQVEQAQQAHSQAINSFLEDNKDIAGNVKAFNLVKEFVSDNFNIDENTSATKLAWALETARNTLFAKSKTTSVKADTTILNATGSQTSEAQSGVGISAEQQRALDQAGIKVSGWKY